MTVSRGATEIAQSVIRRRNLSRMLNELHRRGPLTRSELALSLRVNRSTVASLIAELAARDLVSERYRDKPEVQPTPGRPSPVVEICRDGPAALALELSTDWIRAAVIGLGAWVAVSVRRDLPLASSTPGQALDEMHEIVAPMLKGLVRGPRVVAIGVSVPGAVRAQDGHVYDAPNLGWHDVPLGSLVRRRFHELGVSVFVGNDADLATSAEQLRGSGHGAADFICLWGEGGEESLLRRSGRDPLGGTRALADLLSAADRGRHGRPRSVVRIGPMTRHRTGGSCECFQPDTHLSGRALCPHLPLRQRGRPPRARLSGDAGAARHGRADDRTSRCQHASARRGRAGTCSDFVRPDDRPPEGCSVRVYPDR